MKLPTKLLEDAVNEISKLPELVKNGIKTFPISPKKEKDFTQNLSKSIIDLKENPIL